MKQNFYLFLCYNVLHCMCVFVCFCSLTVFCWNEVTLWGLTARKPAPVLALNKVTALQNFLEQYTPFWNKHSNIRVHLVTLSNVAQHKHHSTSEHTTFSNI